MSKTITAVDDSLYQYILDVGTREAAVLFELRQQTADLEMSAMQISPDQGQFMALLVRLIDARRIIEVGTFTGYSALVMALATHAGAKIVCCDISKEWTGIAKRYWAEAGVLDKIDLRLAPALQTLAALLPNGENRYDFAFIDADKGNYDAYYEHCLQLLRPGGLIAIDNVFWGGKVAHAPEQDDDTRAIDALNKKLHGDERIELSIIPIGDGLTLVRKY